MKNYSWIQIGKYICFYDVKNFRYGVSPVEEYGNLDMESSALIKPLMFEEQKFEKFVAQVEKSSKNFIVNIDWMISGVCNMSCPYCFARCDGSITNLSSAKKIIRILNSINLLHVTLSGGEPTLNPHIEKIIQSLNKDIAVTIDTNGVNLKEYKKLVPILKNRNCNVRITIDSTSDLVLKTLRPLRSNCEYFSDINDAISMFMASNIPVMVHTVVTKKNLKELSNIANYIIKKGIRQWRLYKVIAIDRTVTDTLSVTTDEYLVVLNELRKMYSELQIFSSYEAQDDAVILISPKGDFEIAKYSTISRCCLSYGDITEDFIVTLLENMSIKNHIVEYIGGKNNES